MYVRMCVYVRFPIIMIVWEDCFGMLTVVSAFKHSCLMSMAQIMSESACTDILLSVCVYQRLSF